MNKLFLACLFFTKILTGSSEICPEGWVEVMELGCLHFGSEASSWFGASAHCEEIHPNSSMIEIISQEEKFLLLNLLRTDMLSLSGNYSRNVTCWR